MNTYVVDTAAVKNNAEIIKKHAANANIYGVLKYNGYGLGAEKMAELLKNCGISRFAANEIEDIERLRNTVQPNGEILMLRPTPSEEETEKLIELNAVLTISSFKDALAAEKAAAKLKTRVQVHIKIDTGMGRYGFFPYEIDTILSIYRSCPHIRISGFYTHFSQILNKIRTRRQYSMFSDVLRAVKAAGYDTGICHCSSSSAFFKYDDMKLDAVRIGSAFLGRIPKYERYNLIKTGYCETSINEIKAFPKGWHIGYGAKYKTKKATVCALCDIGNKDGFGLLYESGKLDMRASLINAFLSTAGSIAKSCTLYGEIGGKKIPVLGKTEAGTTVFDITGMNCKCGDKIKLDINPIMINNMEVSYV